MEWDAFPQGLREEPAQPHAETSQKAAQLCREQRAEAEQPEAKAQRREAQPHRGEPTGTEDATHLMRRRREGERRPGAKSHQ